MYLVFEEAGLIVNTEEFNKRQTEKGSATADQSTAEPINNTRNAIYM